MSGKPGLAPSSGPIRHRFVDLDDAQPHAVRLHLVEAGPPLTEHRERSAAESKDSPVMEHPERSAAESKGAPLIILLHGFPEAWFSWQHQIRALAGAGYHVLAPDMRGYNLSDKPKGVHAYRIEHLVGDVAALIRWAGAERATVIGHDWGANVAWHFAMRHPEMLDRLVILNVPHPALMAKALTNPGQLLKSAYMFFFQLPWLPERAFLAGNVAPIRRTLENDPVRKRAFDREDIERFVLAAKQPGAMTCGMNYYRAAFRQPKEQAQPRIIDAPVLVIWGEQDRYLGKELADPPSDLVPNARVERLPDASHWVQNDRPDRVNQLLLDFLKAP
jgi:pimeloyl-ACP methyl ester carboxylesterase